MITEGIVVLSETRLDAALSSAVENIARAKNMTREEVIREAVSLFCLNCVPTHS